MNVHFNSIFSALRPKVVSLYSSKPLVDGFFGSWSISKVIFQLCKRVFVDSGKSFPVRIRQATWRLSGDGRNSNAPSIAGVSVNVQVALKLILLRS